MPTTISAVHRFSCPVHISSPSSETTETTPSFQIPSNSTLIDHPVPFSATYSLWTATPHKEPGKFLILSESPSKKLTVSRADDFLGAFANQLPKATISFVMCVHLSVNPHESARISPDELPWNVISGTCIKSAGRRRFWLKITQKCHTLYMNPYVDLRRRYS